MKVPCKKNLYYHRKPDSTWWGLLEESTSSKDIKVSLAFKAGKDYEVFMSNITINDGVSFIHVMAVGEDNREHTLFSSGSSSISKFFDFDETKREALEKGARRLNIVLDAESFAKLESIKSRHGDSSYTQAINRSLATQKFVDDEMDKGMNLFVGSAEQGDLTRIILPH